MVEEIVKKALREMEQTPVSSFLPVLKDVSAGSVNDVLNVNGCAYYQFLPQLIKILKPKQVVELGGAMGTAAIMMLQTLKGQLYSVTLEEHGLEFCFIKDHYPNLIKIVGNDLDTDIWPEGTDLFLTDIWFFDSEHTRDQLVKELDLYSQFFKKGAILLFDDIHLNEGMEETWKELCGGRWKKMDCYDATDPLHYSGFGVVQV